MDKHVDIFCDDLHVHAFHGYTHVQIPGAWIRSYHGWIMRNNDLIMDYNSLISAGRVDMHIGIHLCVFTRSCAQAHTYLVSTHFIYILLSNVSSHVVCCVYDFVCICLVVQTCTGTVL